MDIDSFEEMILNFILVFDLSERCSIYTSSVVERFKVTKDTNVRSLPMRAAAVSAILTVLGKQFCNFG